jgi:hypothetical protein
VINAALLASLCVGLEVGLDPTCGGSGPPPVFTSDATSGKATPISSAEWTALLAVAGSSVIAPSHLWLLQEASGTAADVYGLKPLTATNVAYQKPIAGWSRLAIGGPGTAIASSLTNATMVDTSTTSFAVLAYVRFDPSPTVVRAMITYGTPTVQEPAATNKVRLREGGSLIDSTNNHNGTVHPFLFVFNVTAQTVRLYTDLEKLSVTWSSSAGSVLTLTGSIATDATFTDFLYAAAWDGVAAEAITDVEAKKIITTLGYSPPWS